MAKSEQKKLGDFTFTVSHLPPRQALPATLLVAELFGPLIANTLGSIGRDGVDSVVKLVDGADKGDDADVDADDLGTLLKLVTGAMSSLSEMKADRLMKLVDVLTECTVVEDPKLGGPLAKRFDAVFDSDIGLQVQWLAFALAVNFGSYFRKAAQAAAASAAKKQQRKTTTAAGADSGTPAGNLAGVAAGDGEDRNAA